MNKQVERLRAIETTSQQVSSLIVNLSALGDFKDYDLECMESFKSIMHLGTDQLKSFIQLLDEKGKDLDEYSIYYYTRQLDLGPLKFFVSKFNKNEDGSLKTYWKLTPDSLGLLSNVNKSQVNIPIINFLEVNLNIDTLTASKMPSFMLKNIQEANIITNSMFALGYISTLEFDTNGKDRLEKEQKGNYNKTAHGSYIVSDTERPVQYSEISTKIQDKVKEFVGEEDYRMYTAKRGYNLFLTANVTINNKVERKLEYLQTNPETGEQEVKSVVIVTDLTGNTFESDKARAGGITITYPEKDVTLKLHTVQGQLGSTTEIKRKPITS